MRDLPEELLIDILCRLPEAKSVVKCHLVCKNWYRILSSTRFFKNFINRNNNKNGRCVILNKLSHFVLEDYFPSFLSTALAAQGLDNIDVHDVSVIGSSHDLLLYRLSKTMYCVCNPFTMEHVILPYTNPINTTVVNGIMANSLVVGFLCDDDDDYSYHSYNYTLVFITTPIRNEITIRHYSSPTKEWHHTSINDLPNSSDYALNKPRCSMVFYKGMGFWIGHTSKICVYDPLNITTHLYTIQPPAGHGLMRHILGVSQGSLKFIHLKYSDRGHEQVDIIAKVWELKDDNLNHESGEGGEWSLVHEVCLNQLRDIYPLSVMKDNLGDVITTLELLAIDPNNADIIYIKVSDLLDISIISCNLRGNEIKQFQAGFFKPWYLKTFAVMAPLWPTPIRIRSLAN
ncbi:hypothetical protein ACFE04_029686 [Oxalis oulophora]